MKERRFYLLAAITIDGKIAKNPSHFSDWTSPEDKVFLRAELDANDVIIVGNNTYKTSIDPLSKRKCIVFTRSVNEPEVRSDLLTYFNPQKSDLHAFLDQQNYQKISLLGGAAVYSYFLEKNLITDFHITIEPQVFGTGINLFDTKNPVDKKYNLVSIKELNSAGTILLHYQPK